MIKRSQAIELLAEHREKDTVVVAVFGSSRELAQCCPGGLNLGSGAMGMGSSVGLGLALAQPRRKVWVLDGDGSLLMNLGSLVTIASQSPPNFYHFVFENGIYEASGGQPVVGAGRLSFAGLARAAGIEKTYEFSELADFGERLPVLLSERGPVFVVLKTEPIYGHLSEPKGRLLDGWLRVKAILRQETT